MVYSIITLETHTPFPLSVDFQSGTRFVLRFQNPITESQIRNVFADFGVTNASVTRLGEEQDNIWQIRSEFLESNNAQQVKAALDAIASIDESQTEIDSVSPTVGAEVTRAATLAVFVTAVFILIFIIIAFRQVPNALRYGTCAIAAMVHDILVAMGFMSIAGLVMGWEADSLFLTAMLTVIGFSVQDTIVVFDRIRENIPKRKHEDFETVVNRSILETLHRSLATQLNAIFVMVALLFFGGASIQQFIAVILVGMISGTYSSIFNAVPLLVAWEKKEIPFLG
ncbi:MAG: protein translocase subunit SecF [Anaerolineales bacterium]|nr:protein translocase subunit SecF [Anaerolineales bacterium]